MTVIILSLGGLPPQVPHTDRDTLRTSEKRFYLLCIVLEKNGMEPPAADLQGPIWSTEIANEYTEGTLTLGMAADMSNPGCRGRGSIPGSTWRFIITVVAAAFDIGKVDKCCRSRTVDDLRSTIGWARSFLSWVGYFLATARRAANNSETHEVELLMHINNRGPLVVKIFHS